MMSYHKEIHELEQPILSKGRIAVSFIIGFIGFSVFFVLGYAITLSLVQIFDLKFITGGSLILVSAISATLGEIGAVTLFNKNKKEYISTSFLFLSIIGLISNIIFMIFNIIGDFDIFQDLCFIAANIFIYIYAKRKKVDRYEY